MQIFCWAYDRRAWLQLMIQASRCWSDTNVRNPKWWIHPSPILPIWLTVSTIGAQHPAEVLVYDILCLRVSTNVKQQIAALLTMPSSEIRKEWRRLKHSRVVHNIFHLGGNVISWSREHGHPAAVHCRGVGGSGGMLSQEILVILGVLRCILVHSEAYREAHIACWATGTLESISIV